MTRNDAEHIYNFIINACKDDPDYNYLIGLDLQHTSPNFGQDPAAFDSEVIYKWFKDLPVDVDPNKIIQAVISRLTYYAAINMFIKALEGKSFKSATGVIWNFDIDNTTLYTKNAALTCYLYFKALNDPSLAAVMSMGPNDGAYTFNVNLSDAFKTEIKLNALSKSTLITTPSITLDNLKISTVQDFIAQLVWGIN